MSSVVDASTTGPSPRGSLFNVHLKSVSTCMHTCVRTRTHSFFCIHFISHNKTLKRERGRHQQVLRDYLFNSQMRAASSSRCSPSVAVTPRVDEGEVNGPCVSAETSLVPSQRPVCGQRGAFCHASRRSGSVSAWWHKVRKGYKNILYSRSHKY